ncbi:MAG: M20/M25/M40 family metallo-hydrolase, partial [Clostridiaceae bacterium]|nr:M20/M25/M40 family metallo-hydrolase [Clostridiaceae bacterium]
MTLNDKVYNTLKELVTAPGVSGTESENLTSEKIYSILSEIPYFKNNKKNFGMELIEEDPYGRSFVWGVVHGKEQSNNTLILTGHLDVVEVEEFGHLKPVAFNIEECTKRISELNLDKEALRDLESGKWIFGRGTADMKYGIALDIEMLRELSEERNFKGNLLFLAVPGEESNSEGMIASVPFLLKLQEERGYDYCGVIVSECCIPDNENDKLKKLYMGTVGKIMPLFFCVGKETHVGESLKGLNPNALVSEINRLLEYNPDFSDQVNDTTTPPPTCLKQLDLKELSLKAFNNVLDLLKEKRDKFIKKSSDKVQYIEVEPCVMTYEELLMEVKAKVKDFDKYIKDKVELWKKEKMDNQAIAINIVKETYEKYNSKKPMIIVSFIPPYYPH